MSKELQNSTAAARHQRARVSGWVVGLSEKGGRTAKGDTKVLIARGQKNPINCGGYKTASDFHQGGEQWRWDHL